MVEAEEMTWDLTVLFEDFNDPQITETIESVTKGVIKLEQDFKGKINTPETTPADLLNVYKQAETLLMRCFDVYNFAYLSVSADQSNKAAQALSDKTKNLMVQYQKHLAFLELEVGALLESRGHEFLEAPVLSEIKHYLEKIAEKRPFKLSEPEEKLILEKNRHGIQEWENLQRRWVATRSFTLLVEGEEKKVSWSSGRKYLYHPAREVRKEATKKMMGGLGTDVDLFAAALRSVCGDHIANCKLRGYPTPMESSLIFNDITQEMLDSMIEVVEANVGLLQEFLLLKAKLLGTEKLRGEDLYAPLPEEADRKVTWTEAQAIAIDCYSEFDSEFGTIVRGMFENRRIDAAPRSTKVAGAFCAGWYAGKSAFILQSFNERINDIQTLVHELGHAVHAHLANEKQPFWNIANLTPMGLAETASEFGGMLFIDRTLRTAADDKTKRGILFNALERILNVVFEVSSRIRFEQSLYNAIEEGEFLGPDKINELFWQARGTYFGNNVVKWLPEQVYEWCWKPHYYLTRFRFYNYPYVFGELLVLALYQKYRQEGGSFVPKYKEFLAGRGAQSPQKLVKALGLDLSKRKIWEDGMNEIKRLLDEFKALFD